MKNLIPLAALLLLTACAESPTDDRLEEAVKATIRQHPALLADNLTIRSESGVVYIRGMVATQVEFVEVEQVLKSTPGVTKFVNMTTIDNARF